jgi:3-dehydrotetronate 4-kinase
VRSAPARQAVSETVSALTRLRAAGCRLVFFKCCSTLDSAEARDIGPVTDASLAALGVGLALACSAFPLNARGVYNGYLFVGGVLLSWTLSDHAA